MEVVVVLLLRKSVFLERSLYEHQMYRNAKLCLGRINIDAIAKNARHTRTDSTFPNGLGVSSGLPLYCSFVCKDFSLVSYYKVQMSIVGPPLNIKDGNLRKH